MFKLIKYLENYKKQTILGPIFKMLEAFFELLVPLVMAKMIDEVIYNKNQSYIYKMGIVLIILAIVGYLSSVTCQYFASYTSQGFGTELRNDLFGHIMNFSYDDIDQVKTPSLITRLSNDINNLQLAVAMFIRLAFRTPFIIIGATIMSFYIDIKLSLVFILMIPLLAICVYFIIRLSTPIYSKISKRLDQIALVFRENLSGIRVIRAFSREKDEVERFNHEIQLHKEDSIKVGKIAALNAPLTMLILNFSIMLILYQSGIRINVGDLTLGEVIALVNYMNQILAALLALSMIVSVFNKASISAKRINEVLEHESSLKEMIINHDKENNEDIIVEFHHVSYKYSGSHKYVLKDIHFKIERNKTIGIIGGTGSGKTTLISLIPRFYEVSEGCILFNGKNVSDYSFDELRNKIGLVPQNATLFSGSIRDNLKLNNKDLPDETLIKALKTAQAYEFVSKLENGLNEQVSQAGKNFSGGQKQRLTIARAIARDPEIIILDDSSSALDYVTDLNLRKALRKDLNQSSVVIVTQRVSAIKDCDLILVIDKAEIVGQGNHEDLYKECDVYREICLSQSSGKKVSNDE